MKGYLVKETNVATRDNSSFAGELRAYIIGKGDQLICGSGSPRKWENFDYSHIYIPSHCYKRKCDAKRNYTYKNPNHSPFWESTVEIIEVEI